METKILFADIDGTLLNDQKEIPKENMTAIQKALDHGHYVVVATGRPLDSAKAVAKDLGLMMQGCYLIAYNGAIVYDCGNEKVLKKESLPLAYVKELFERCFSTGFNRLNHLFVRLFAKSIHVHDLFLMFFQMVQIR